jgi:hypothetical protein
MRFFALLLDFRVVLLLGYYVVLILGYCVVPFLGYCVERSFRFPLGPPRISKKFSAPLLKLAFVRANLLVNCAKLRFSRLNGGTYFEGAPL